MPNGGVPHYTVGEFSRRMQDVFRRVPQFKYLSVSGEISEVHPRNNGTYFTLKDAGGVLQCFAYPNRAAQFGPLPVGSAVIAFGTVRVASWRSRYELLVTMLQRTGIGELHRQYEALKERFRALGFFERARKREIPSFPVFVALISARGKGAEDFQETLRLRAPQVRVEFFETRVQGLAADADIAEAIDRAAASGADAIVLARGGGSYEDLFTFNCEPVVRAIVRSPVVVITGIGHTADHHLADDVADYECETPSNAAQLSPACGNAAASGSHSCACCSRVTCGNASPMPYNAPTGAPKRWPMPSSATSRRNAGGWSQQSVPFLRSILRCECSSERSA